jgi:hypothetical protein
MATAGAGKHGHSDDSDDAKKHKPHPPEDSGTDDELAKIEEENKTRRQKTYEVVHKAKKTWFKGNIMPVRRSSLAKRGRPTAEEIAGQRLKKLQLGALYAAPLRWDRLEVILRPQSP